MNYLAHLYLAEDQPGLVIGGFLADFVKGPLRGDYALDIEIGMQLHRKIDTWSDQHGSVKAIRQLLPKEFGRYSGIIADVLVDHVLSKSWDSYATDSLEGFAEHRIAILQAQSHNYPERAQQVLKRMVQGNWLTSYQNIDYCLATLGHIGTRLRRENPLHMLEQPVKQNYQQLSLLCAQILNDLRVDVAEWRAVQAQQTT